MKKGSKAGTRIISFLLGFLFAILVIAGAVFGVGYYALNGDLNSIFNLVGFTNKDADGNQYVNTDKNNDGVKSVLDLYGRLKKMYEGIGAVTIGDMESLFPALDGLTASIYDVFDDYMAFTEEDRAEIERTQFMDLPTYLQEKVMEIEPAKIVRQFQPDLLDADGNEILKALLEGKEADYVVNGTLQYPVYYDEYVYNSDLDAYNRTGDSMPYPSNVTNKESWLVPTGKTEAGTGYAIYRQYYYLFDTQTSAEGVESKTYYVTKQNDDGDYVYSVAGATLAEIAYVPVYEQWTSAPTGRTGYYYYDNSSPDRVKVVERTVTLKSISEDALEPLYDVYVNDIIDTGEQVVADVFEGMTFGELIGGDGVTDILDRILIPTVMSTEATEPVLMYIGYNVTDVTANGDGTYSGVYAKGEYDENSVSLEKAVTIHVDARGVVTQVVADDGTVIKGMSVSKSTTLVKNIENKLAVSDVMAVTPLATGGEQNNIMTFLAFSVTDVQAVSGREYAYTGVYYAFEDGEGNPLSSPAEYPCEIYTGLNGDGQTVITKVVYYPDGGSIGKEGAKTLIAGVSDQVNNLTKAIKIKNLINISADDRILSKLGEYSVANVGDAVNDLRIDDVMDIDVNNAIMTYIAYGISGLKEVGPYSEGGANYVIYSGLTAAGETVYIKATGGSARIIKGFYTSFDGSVLGVETTVDGTRINAVGDRVDGLTANLTLGDVIPVSDDDLFLSHLKNSKLNNIAADMENLYVQTVFKNDIYSDGSTPATGQTVTEITAENVEHIYYTDAACTELAGLNGDGKLSVGDVGTFYTYGAPYQLWRFLLYDPATGEEVLCKVSDMGTLMDNAIMNIQSATLGDLQDAGIIDQTLNLNKYIDANFNNVQDEGEKSLKDYTLNDLVNYISGIAKDSV